jgi:DNA polymerase-3 subunit delta
MPRQVLYADAVPPEEIIAAGLALPLFGGRRLIVVRGLADAPAKLVERIRAAIEAARGRPSGWPDPTTTVIFVAGGVDRKSPVLRLLPEPQQVDVRAPTGRALAGWLRDRARDAGLDLAPDAAQALVEQCGEDAGRLVGELEKLGLHADADRRVSAETVRALAGEGRARPFWELTQALESGNAADSLRVLAGLLAAGDDALAIHAWIVGYLRNLWRALGVVAEGGDAGRVGRSLRPPRPDWVAERLIARASSLGARGIADGLRRAVDVERALKTGGGDPRALLTDLVAQLAR